MISDFDIIQCISGNNYNNRTSSTSLYWCWLWRFRDGSSTFYWLVLYLA